MLFFCKKHSVCLLIIQKQHKCLIFKQFYNILFFCKLSENQYFSATEEQQKTIKINGMLWYDDRYHLLRNISVILIMNRICILSPKKRNCPRSSFFEFTDLSGSAVISRP